MAMSGTIKQTQVVESPLGIYDPLTGLGGTVGVNKQIHWSARKTADNTVVITCYYQVKTTNGNDAFYALKGTCTFTINGVEYSVATPVTSAWCQDFKTASVTSKPITITAIEDDEEISIAAKWNPEGSIGYFNNYNTWLQVGLNAAIPTNSTDYSTCSGTASVGSINTPTEIVFTGTEISNESILDIVNHRTHSGVTHSLSYTVGGDTYSLFTERSGDYLDFTLPEELAERIPRSNSLSVKFTLTTHFPWGGSGSRTKSVTYTLPDKDIFRPHCNIKVTDGEHRNNVQLVDKYGAFVKGYSRFKVVAEPVLAYGSKITSITIKAAGETHVGYYDIETKFLNNVGEHDITVTLSDQRGRSNEFTITKNVVDYKKPYVSDIKLDRCDSVGEIDSSGEYIKVTFDAEITPLKNLNSATYTLQYMTSAGLDQHDINLTEFTGQYSIKGGTYIFKADSGNEYSVTLTATDDLDSAFLHEGSKEATTIWNAGAEGNSFAFGKISELPGVLENMFKFFPIGGFMFPEFKGSTLMTPNHVPNVYTVASGKDIEKSPFEGEYTLIVLPGGGVGDFVLIAITCDLEIKINSYSNSSWSGNWKTLH